MSAARRYDWESIRAEYEAGASQSDLARRYGLSRTAIQKRIKAESWMQDVSQAIDRLTEAKVAGVVAGCNPQKKAEALNRAADAKADVIRRHKTEWEQHKVIMDEALANGDFNAAKLAKITAETLKIRQDGERRAWGIQDKSESCQAVPVRAEVRLDLSGQSPQAVAELARAAFRAEDAAASGGEA